MGRVVMFFIDTQKKVPTPGPDFTAQTIGLAGKHQAAVQKFAVVALAQAL
ncbi:MAG: hypothetical protein RIF32_07180 [Leptospirales bacterium]